LLAHTFNYRRRVKHEKQSLDIVMDACLRESIPPRFIELCCRVGMFHVKHCRNVKVNTKNDVRFDG
jgi:hypothetical protein